MILMPSGPSLTMRVCVDANAAIDYAREYTLHYFGMEPTGRKADILRKRMCQEEHVLVAETAAKEAKRNLVKDLVQKLGRQKAHAIREKAMKILLDYCDEARCGDELEHIPAVQEMYASIESDPTNRKFSNWKKKKSRFAVDPVLGSDINDLKILSTAIHYALLYAVEFWTHDMDFTMFADEIFMMFGLVVVDTYRLGNRFL